MTSYSSTSNGNSPKRARKDNWVRFLATQDSPPTASSAPLPGTGIFDRRNHCIAVSDSLAEILELPQARIIGMHSEEIFRDPTMHIVRAFARVWKTGRPLRGIELNAAFSSILGRRDWIVDVLPIEPLDNSSRHIAMVMLQAKSFYSLRKRTYRGGRERGDWFAAEQKKDLNLQERLVLDDQMFLNALNQMNRCRSLRAEAAEFSAAVRHRQRALDTMAACEESGIPATDLVRRSVGADASDSAARQQCSAPSMREREVLQLLSVGRTNKEIANELGLSVRTVETYRARLMAKLGLHNTADAVHYAIRSKLVTC